jgi:hypothetical protein
VPERTAAAEADPAPQVAQVVQLAVVAAGAQLAAGAAGGELQAAQGVDGAEVGWGRRLEPADDDAPTDGETDHVG